MTQQAGVNNCYLPWPGQPTTNPYYIPLPHPGGLGSVGFGIDPNPSLTAALNRLAAALEKFNERK